ncbi:hypothetical protein PPERSA_12032 [Pseudocohnilembus persalinus]|uniref:Uncharacterized protein n=1 Tax=Pseudocohnilembus persalinus TaxID=266149 RepID=A0A0V0R8S5_PSEPJ|nr:hypothetical protein PPERSA_12032 [Pseudocohnilembus persalinus]|eukprot:KRX10908.1 hypothetical protein PPERSA_12032 [Pseudocohnilembus persalinus]
MDNKTKDNDNDGRQFCQKPRHNKEEFQYLNWIDDKQNILLCPNCLFQDNNPNNTKLYIKQILNLQENQSINNWPLGSSEQTQEIIEKWQKKSNQKEHFQKLKQQMINEVEKYFESKLSEIKTAILTKKKNCIQKLNDIFEKEMQFLNENNLQEIFDLKEIKKSLQSYYSNQSGIDELFKIQQDKKKKFIEENKIQEINAKLEKMTANLEKDKKDIIIVVVGWIR